MAHDSFAPDGIGAHPQRAPWSAILRRRWGWIAAGLLLGLLAGLTVLLFTSPAYVATSKVSLRTVVLDPFQPPGDISKTISMETERQVAGSTNVAQGAQQLLGSSLSTKEMLRHLSVANPPSTQILSFTYSSGSAATAEAGANAFGKSYLDYRQSIVARSIKTITASLKSQVMMLQTTLGKINQQLVSATGSTRNTLVSQQQSATSQLVTVQRRIDDLGAIDTTPGYVTQTATEASHANTSASVVLALAALLGSIVGIIAARLRESADTRIWDSIETGEILGAPVLTTRPLRLGRFSSNDSHRGQEFRALALRLRHSFASNSAPIASSLAVVSAGRLEGRTRVTAYLADAFAELDETVVAVASDLVRPTLSDMLITPPSEGSVEVPEAVHTEELEDGWAVTVAGNPVARLSLVRSGGPQSGWTERLRLLSNLRPLISSWRRKGDVILLDTPPLFEVPDTLVIAEVVDSVLVVVVIGRTTRLQVSRMASALDSFDVPIVGILPVRRRWSWRWTKWSKTPQTATAPWARTTPSSPDAALPFPESDIRYPEDGNGYRSRSPSTLASDTIMLADDPQRVASARRRTANRARGQNFARREGPASRSSGAE